MAGWCVDVYCSSSLTYKSGGAGLWGHPMQARTNALLTSALARERTHARTMCRHERKKRKPVQANACRHTPVRLRARLGVRARTSLYTYNPHKKHFSAIFPRSGAENSNSSTPITKNPTENQMGSSAHCKT